MKSKPDQDWQKKSPEEKAKVYDNLADLTKPGYSRDTYLEMAKKLRGLKK